jgi:hypothetical protein
VLIELQRSRTFLESALVQGKVPGVLDAIMQCVASNYSVVSLCFEYYASRSMTNTMPVSMDKKAYLEWISDAEIVDAVRVSLGCQPVFPAVVSYIEIRCWARRYDRLSQLATLTSCSWL